MPQSFHVIAYQQETFLVDDTGDPVDRLLVGGREYHQGTAHPDALKNNAQQLQPGERQQSGGDTEPVHARADGQTDTGGRPDTGGGSLSPHELFLDDDRTRPDETDATHHLGGHTARIEAYAIL